MKALLLIFSLVFCIHFNMIGQTTARTELPTMSLEDAGFNTVSIENLIHLLATSRHRDFVGMVVVKDNQLVIEEYFSTHWRISISDIRSAGKSITALLLGIAIDQGLGRISPQ